MELVPKHLIVTVKLRSYFSDSSNSDFLDLKSDIVFNKVILFKENSEKLF